MLTRPGATAAVANTTTASAAAAAATTAAAAACAEVAAAAAAPASLAFASRRGHHLLRAVLALASVKLHDELVALPILQAPSPA